MPRKVFYSFHFDNDNWRAAQVRNIGSVEGDKQVNGNKWEDVKNSNDQTIKDWINQQISDKSCLVVLIGEKTSERRWVKYEIDKALAMGKAVCGVYIHKLADSQGKQSLKGKIPFSSKIPVFDSDFATSRYVYDDIKDNISDLVERAIRDISQYR